MWLSALDIEQYSCICYNFQNSFPNLLGHSTQNNVWGIIEFRKMKVLGYSCHIAKMVAMQSYDITSFSGIKGR